MVCGPRRATWRPDVETITHYPDILDSELHVMTGLDFRFVSLGKISEFQPLTHLLPSPPTFPLGLVSIPTVGTRKTLQSTAGALSEWGRWLFPSCIPQGLGRRHQILIPSFPLIFLLIFDTFQFSNGSLSSIFFKHSFSLGFITFGNKRWVIRILGSGSSPWYEPCVQRKRKKRLKKPLPRVVP